MGKKGSDLSKNARQEFLVQVLNNFATGEGLTTSEIIKLMNDRQIYVTRRTIYRDLEDLSRFPSLSEKENDGETRWIWIRDNNLDSEISIIREQKLNEILKYLKIETAQ